MASVASFNEFKRHFQTILMVYDEKGTSFFFRFYDPRVFRVYLPTCIAGKIETIYGPVEKYITENEEKNRLIEYTHTRKYTLIKKTRKVNPLF